MMILIYIDNIPKPTNGIFNYIKNLNPVNSKKRVCKKCLDSIKKTIKIKKLIDIFSFIDLDIIDYYKIRRVSKDRLETPCGAEPC